MTIPVYLSDKILNDDGELVIDADEPATDPRVGAVEQICYCGHRADTHDPCCVSACGCDGFNPRQPVLPVEEVFKFAMREIKEVAQGALGYDQICDPVQAVRRLAQEFATTKAQLAEANASNAALCETIADMTRGNIAAHERFSPVEAENKRLRGALVKAEKIAQEAVSILADAHDEDAGCSFTLEIDAEDSDVGCLGCLAQLELAKITVAALEAPEAAREGETNG